MPSRKTTTTKLAKGTSPLHLFAPAVQDWFNNSFPSPTAAQALGWPAIAGGESTLIFAPTGSGKTLTAFLWCINRLMFAPLPEKERRCRVLYVSPLKALAVDVERNLRSPIVGISHAASARGDRFVIPEVMIRTGDTPAKERARFQRQPADILITTPESLYLLLTSNARENLRSIETVIIDEIHSLVPGKRGAHLALSLERLERLTRVSPRRIGLSATQSPLEEVARYLGGTELRKSRPPEPEDSINVHEADEERLRHEIEREFETDEKIVFRPVTIVDTGEKKKLAIRVEVPLEDMAQLGTPIDIPSGPASQGAVRRSIWPAIHPRLLELIRQHQSTLIFVNSRRLAERLAGSLNELAGEVIVSAHHGSIAREQRLEIEDNLKSGRIPALVATSSLELGIDMGAIDLVIQIEAPPSVAAGMQRIGRASHQAGAVSKGIVFPKYRGDLVACAAITDSMHNGRIESIRYPRNPLDVLAQQIVAMTSLDAWHADDLFNTIRCAAPFAELSRSLFDSILDMLSGLYPSDEFAELRPRITWDRLANMIVARPGSRLLAVVNAGTIPDRGLYGVFLLGSEKGGRVGELDEEMVFECREGETFVLGASTWRIEQITHDRVLVSPAPGQPGKMPFWHGDSADRPVELGRRIGELVRTLRSTPRPQARAQLIKRHDLDERAADNLLQYLDDQQRATEVVPDDRTIVIERCVDELGDWRVCVLSPFGGKVHAPWAMAVIAKVRNEMAIDVEAMWTDDGFVIRFPETETPPDVSLMLPGSEEVESLVVRQLGSSALFAARFREVATRALLLPRRRPGMRTPLWHQRKRSSDLLAVAARFGSFPMLLEAYRECLRDVFDMPAALGLMRKIEERSIRVVTVDTETPSPFASSLLFQYVANYIYDGDAPLAERRAHALAIDQSKLRELLGEAELRDLLDADAIDQLELQLQYLDPAYKTKSADAVHDLLLRIGDLTAAEIRERSSSPEIAAQIENLVKQRRILKVKIGGQSRLVASEDASRYRDALGAALPPGLPERLLRPVADPVSDLVSRYARTHGPFILEELTRRFGAGRQLLEQALGRLTESGRLIEGEFRPGGTHREWIDREVLRTLRRRSLAVLRKEVEPAAVEVFGRFLTQWQGIRRNGRGLNAILESIESLQGCPLPASILEREILPARVSDYSPADLDTLAAAGEIVWIGIEPLGERDGRIALFLADHLPLLHAPSAQELDPQEQKLAGILSARGASFFAQIHEAWGGGFAAELVDVMWGLVWKGVITNDTFHALRAYTRGSARGRQAGTRAGFRSRRLAPQQSQGRWSLVADLLARKPGETERRTALAQQLLNRYGVLVRESASAEAVPGGFSTVYDVLKFLEESGKIRRGYFVTDVAATQFALPAAVELLRSLRIDPESPETVWLAATDPANPYGSLVKWPETDHRPTRSVGANVILVNGALAAWVGKGEKQLLVFLPEDEPRRSTVGRETARELASLVRGGRRKGLLIGEINGKPADEHPFGTFLKDEGFVETSFGYQLRQKIGVEPPKDAAQVIARAHSRRRFGA